jgi:hypothetical protein
VPRTVRLVLVSPHGHPLGEVGPFEVESPWWPDVEPVVATARARYDLDVTVLRLLGTDGAVTYLAEAPGPAPVAAVTPGTSARAAAALADHPLRAPWARPGGPASIVAWADGVLSAAGTPRTGPVEQVKTWNLSSILRLPTADGPVWCKSVPPFFAHEAATISLVAARHPQLVPAVLGADPGTGTMLLADVPGTDQWEAPLHRLEQMVDAVVAIQSGWVGRTSELLALGLPDWRGPALGAALTELVALTSVRAQLTHDELARLDELVARLPTAVDELAGCGLPDTLVHGDLHPGNWRYGPGGLLLLDWGDSGVGNPLLDLPAFVERVADDDRPAVRRAWLGQWRHRHQQADVDRAAELVGPLAALRQALIYQGFLDRIEPDERVYHRDDVARWLRRAIEAPVR